MSHKLNVKTSDWYCRKCKDGNDKPFVNHSYRTKCRDCGIDKSKCCSGVVKPTQPSRSARQGTKAEQQVREAHAAAKAAKKEVQQLQKQAEDLRKEKLALQKLAPQVFSMDDDDEMGEQVVVVHTIEQYQARVDLFRSQGFADESPEIAVPLAEIERAKKAKLASKPGSEQLRKLERLVAKADSNVEANRKKLEEHQKAGEELRKESERLQLIQRDAQTAHDELVATLRSSQKSGLAETKPEVAKDPALDKLFWGEGAPSDDDLERYGDWGKIFKARRDREIEERQRQVDDETRRRTEAAAEDAARMAADKAAAEVAREAAANAEKVAADEAKANATLAEEAAALGNSEEEFKKAIGESDPALRAELAKRILIARRARDPASKRAGPY